MGLVPGIASCGFFTGGEIDEAQTVFAFIADQQSPGYGPCFSGNILTREGAGSKQENGQ